MSVFRGVFQQFQTAHELIGGLHQEIVREQLKLGSLPPIILAEISYFNTILNNHEIESSSEFSCNPNMYSHLTKPQNLAKLMGTHPPDPFNVQERHPLSHEQQQWHSASGHPQGDASFKTQNYSKRQTASRNMDVKGYLCVLFGRFTPGASNSSLDGFNGGTPIELMYFRIFPIKNGDVIPASYVTVVYQRVPTFTNKINNIDVGKYISQLNPIEPRKKNWLVRLYWG